MRKGAGVAPPCARRLALSSLFTLRVPPPVTDKYLSRDPEEEMRRAFALFDEDGTGRISLKHVRRVARELGETITDEELTAMIGECAAAPRVQVCVCG